MGTLPEYRVLDKDDTQHEHNDQTDQPVNPPQHVEHNVTDTKNLYKLDKFLKWYLIILSIYLAASIAAVAWSYTGALLDDDASKRRVFRTGDNVPVNQLYSGIALSAILAPAGVLVQWVVHEFRRLHLFALAAQRPVRVRDLDELSDNFSVWTMRTVARYSWWYGLMQSVLILTRTLLVPVGTLILTVGPYTYAEKGHGVVGLPLSRADASTMNITALSAAMGGSEANGFRPSFAKNDTFLSQVVYTFVGNLVSQSALVDIDSGTLGPVPTHNLTFQQNTTYDGLVFFRWDANCEAATEVSYSSTEHGGNTTYNFTLPGGHVESLTIMDSQRIRLWNNATDGDEMPTGGTTYYLSATRSIPTINETALRDRGADRSIVKTADGNWISRTKCTPSFEWMIGSCSFDGTIMTACVEAPGSNTSSLDTQALDALSGYMTATQWYIWKNKISIVDDTLDELYSIPSAEDLGHFLGNTAHAIASISTAGYYGTSSVPIESLVTEQVYVVRCSVLIAVTTMLTLAVAVSVLDIVRNKTRGLPYLPAGFLAIAHAVRGEWWDRELDGRHGWDGIEARASHGSTVMFGVDRSDPTCIRLAPSVDPIP